MVRGRDVYGPGFWKGGPGWPGWASGTGWGGGAGWAGGGSCRLYPWLPRRWWAYAPASAGAAAPASWAPLDEKELLQRQADFLKAELSDVERRLSELKGPSVKDQDEK